MGLYKEQTVGWQFDVLWTRSGCVSEGGNDILDHGPRENQIKMYKVTNAIRINHYLIAWQRYYWVTLQMLPSHSPFPTLFNVLWLPVSFLSLPVSYRKSHISSLEWTLGLKYVYLRWFWRWNFEIFQTKNFQNFCLYIL